MSGLFDLHFALRARSSWSTSAASLAAFKAMFPTIEDQTLLSDAYDVLCPGGDTGALDIRPGYTPSGDRMKLPAIVITMSEEPVDEQPLGYATGGIGEAVETEGLMVRQSLSVHVMTRQPVATRLLHVALRGAVLAGRGWFYTQGYRGFEYAGGGDFSPSMDFMPEYLGAYGRVQRWTTLAHIQFAEITATQHDGVVASTDQTVSGIVGGVAALQQIG